jgi:hypothetical protein
MKKWWEGGVSCAEHWRLPPVVIFSLFRGRVPEV